MKILVTGGSGFLGARLIPRLLDDGHTVFALARSTTSSKTVRALGATPVLGDLESTDGLSLPPIEAVVHAAAHFRFAGPRAPYFRANVAGTEALLIAAQKAGAATFVYISAGAVVMDDRGAPLRNVDETAPTYPHSFSGYIASKTQGEAAVLAANRAGFRTIALRPPAIWGPDGPFSKQLPGAIESGQFAFVARGEYPYSTIHVDNVVEAVQCALERGTGGRPYFINDRDPITFREFVAGLAEVEGLSIDNLRSVPYRVAFTLARAMEVVAALRSSNDTDPPLTRTMIRMIGREFTTNDAAARRELGYVGAIARAEGLGRMAQRA
jgi:nucleoside-diphosphate-sugar epimerase